MKDSANTAKGQKEQENQIENADSIVEEAKQPEKTLEEICPGLLSEGEFGKLYVWNEEANGWEITDDAFPIKTTKEIELEKEIECLKHELAAKEAAISVLMEEVAELRADIDQERHPGRESL